MAPGHCIVNLSSDDPRGFIDTLLSPPAVDPRIYVSYQAVVDMGRKFGLPSPEDHEALMDTVEAQEKELDHLREENKSLERDVLSAEWTLERQFGAKIQNKPGRPRKESASV